MNTIILKDNLSDHFDLIAYPDGQHSIKLKLNMLNIKNPTEIICRIKNFSELEVLLCLYEALNKNDFHVRYIKFAYLFGIRSDRAFNSGEPNYTRDVLGKILSNHFFYSDMRLLWPFSPLCIDLNHIEGMREHYYSFNLDNTEENIRTFVTNNYSEDQVISGDGSARYWCNCNYIGFNFFVKKRENGKIIVELPKEIPTPKNNTFLIVDDLCDGGGTFIAEAKYLREKYPGVKLHLAIFHGLFTQGLEPLLEYFDEIIATNSYQDIDHPRVKQFKVI